MSKSLNKICVLLLFLFLMGRANNTLLLCGIAFFPPPIILSSNSGDVMKVMVMWRRGAEEGLSKAVILT